MRIDPRLAGQVQQYVRSAHPEADLGALPAALAQEVARRFDLDPLEVQQACQLELSRSTEIGEQIQPGSERLMQHSRRGLAVGQRSVAGGLGGPMAAYMGLSTPEAAGPPVDYGPLGRERYLPYAQEKIDAKFGVGADPALLEARAQLWANRAEVERAFNAASGGDVVADLYASLGALSAFARAQLEERPEEGLGSHLAQARAFAEDLLLDADGASRFPGILSDRQAQLFAQVVAPVHDALKFLGPKEAQIMPDHEVIGADFIHRSFAGKEALLGGKPTRLSQQDVDFIAAIVGDHENLEKEEGRRDFITAGDAATRAKALFFITDVLTGVFAPGADGAFTIDAAQLEARFTDLYFRHIDLEKGKIFRPLWGAMAMGDLTRTIDELERQGMKIAPGPDGRSTGQVLIDAALDGIDMARAADRGRTDKRFSPEQLAEIDRAEQPRRALRAAAG